jgi:putative hydrolase of the HAD superfamily
MSEVLNDATNAEDDAVHGAAAVVPDGVRAVLVDADGVVQVNADDWLDRLRAFVAPDRSDAFVDDLFSAERDAMCGRCSFGEVVATVCERWGLDGRDAELVDHWRHAVVQEEVLEVVADLRASGVACHLATNQNDVRAAYLRDDLGYADHFDGLLVSCELGATKDDPAFFAAALARLGLRPEQALLVDDSEDHVRQARDAGLQGVRWEVGDGVDELRRRLAGGGRPGQGSPAR